MMTRFAKWLSVGLVAAGFALLGAPRDAHATLVLEGTVDGVNVFAADENNAALTAAFLTNHAGQTNIVILDTSIGIGGTLSLAPGTIIPGYTVQSSSNFVSMASGSDQNISSNALQIVNNTGASVTTNIVVGDNNFVGPANQATATAGGTFLNAAGSTYSVEFYNDPLNRQPLDVSAIPGTLIASNNFGVVGPGTFTVPSFNSPTIPVADPGNFGMSLRFTFTLVNGGTFVSRGESEQKTPTPGGVVPEPSTLVVAFTGLALCGGASLKRRFRKAS